MDVKTGYKQTEVGVIPADWDAVPLGTVTSDIGDGIHATPVYSSIGNYYFINGNNLHDGRIVVTGETKTVGYSEFKKHRKALGDKSILMSINGTIGNLGLFAGEAVILGKSAAYLNVKDGVSKLFVYHTIQTEPVTRQFSDGLTGTTIRNLGLATIRNTRIALPPTNAEQEAIAGALSDTDALIESLEQLLAKKRQLKQGAMQELLTGKERLPGFESKRGYKQTEVGVIPEDWECTNVPGIASPIRNAIVGGPFGSDLVSNDYIEDGIPVVRGQNMGARFVSGSFAFVTKAKASSLEANLARPADLIFTQRGTLGQVSLVPDKPYDRYLVSQSQMKLTVNRRAANPLFFYYVFSSPQQQEIIRLNTIQTGVPHINLGILRSIPVQRPLLVEQEAIAEALGDMDAEIAALEVKLAKARQLKQGMMQELLTGRIRLPVDGGKSGPIASAQSP